MGIEKDFTSLLNDFEETFEKKDLSLQSLMIL